MTCYSRTAVRFIPCHVLLLAIFVVSATSSIGRAQSAVLSGNPVSSFPSPPSLSNDPAKARLRLSDLPTELPRPDNGATQNTTPLTSNPNTGTSPSVGGQNNLSSAGLGTPVGSGVPASGHDPAGTKTPVGQATASGTKTSSPAVSRPLGDPPTVPHRPEQSATGAASTQENSSGVRQHFPIPEDLFKRGDFLTSQSGIVNTLKMILTLTILSLAPAIVMMTTSFVRIITVLSILRQALGTGQLPPNQVLTALSIFLTLLIMFPVWNEVYVESIQPYSREQITIETAFQKGSRPIRTFMVKQIERCGNTNDIWMFMRYIPDAKTPEYYDEVPWPALLPAFMLSELKTAFLIGFQIFIPFIVVDLVVAGVMVSMGMMMLPPVVISLPFKLILFVMMDGWTLVVKMLLDSFVWYTGG